jgi:hypothetical protein
VTGSGGRLHFGMVADIKSERRPTSNRNPRPDCVGIRNDRHGALLDADMTADALILMEHQLKHGESNAPRSWTST